MKRRFLLPILCFFIVLRTNAQKLSFDNVIEISLRSAGIIKQSEQVKGYYFFYETDKVNKKTKQYSLQITDEKLTKLKDVTFEDKNDVVVYTSSFNGSDLLFQLYYPEDSKIKYKLYGADGNAKWEYETEFREMYFISSMPDEIKNSIMKQSIGDIFPVNDKGFISKRSYKGGKSFEIDFYSSQSKKQWTYLPTDGKFISGTYLGNDGKFIFLAVYKLTGMFDRNPDQKLVALDMETGKVVYERPAEQSNYKFVPAISYTSDKALPLIFGEYFDSKQSMVKDKSLGMGFWQVDEKGNIVKEKLISWENIFSRKFSVTDKGKIEGFGYLFVHDIIRLNNGQLFLVGEGYTTSGAKTYTTDMMLLQFDPGLELQDIQVFSKQANPVDLDGGGIFMSTQAKGYVMKFEDKFDYAYMIKNAGNSSFAVCYSNYVRSKSYKGGTFNSITYDEGKVTTDKINTKSDATISAIFPAKQGQVLVVDYYKKEKRLDMHFEKLN